MSKAKSILFALFFLVAIFEQFFHYHSLLKGVQPNRVKLPSFSAQLSPVALVYDRSKNFFASFKAKIIYEDGTKTFFHYLEEKVDAPNSLEAIILRKTFTSAATPEMINFYFCQKNLKSLRELSGKSISEVSILNLDNTEAIHFICNTIKN